MLQLRVLKDTAHCSNYGFLKIQHSAAVTGSSIDSRVVEPWVRVWLAAEGRVARCSSHSGSQKGHKELYVSTTARNLFHGGAKLLCRQKHRRKGCKADGNLGHWLIIQRIQCVQTDRNSHRKKQKGTRVSLEDDTDRGRVRGEGGGQI